MKFLVILVIATFITLLLYLRLRPFIRMARQMFGVARGVRQVMRNGPVATPGQTGGTGEKLVRCAACETWIPAGRALKLRSSNASYCSHDCLEQASQGSQRKAAS